MRDYAGRQQEDEMKAKKKKMGAAASSLLDLNFVVLSLLHAC
jgi:hypothetical protein